MTHPEAHILPRSSGAPSLEERLADALAEIERLVKLVNELRQENLALRQTITALEQKILALQEALNRNSTNSNQPPSLDSPFEPPKKEAAVRHAAKASPPSPAKKSRPYHKGAGRRLLPPDEVIPCLPGPCSCGCSECVDVRALWLHQWLELPARLLHVVHFLVHEGRCAGCGKRLKGHVPVGHESGFGPDLTALMATLNAGMGVSWRKLGDCLQQVFGIPISQGAINKCLKRASLSIEAHDEAIGRAVRASPVNHADETTWRQHGPLGKKLLWLWVLVNREAALFRLAESRKAEEFEALRCGWTETLISDDYGVYLSWEHGRQTCLAHLLRAARGLSESGDERTAACGRWGFGELSRLLRMSPESTTSGELRAFYARFCRYVALYRDVAGKAGAFVRRLDREFGELVSFLVIPGVEPTNNLAERSVRHGVVRRKISMGTSGEWGRRWVERSLSLYQTCLSQKKGFFEVMREALRAFFHNQPPDLGWIEDIAAKYKTAAEPNPASP